MLELKNNKHNTYNRCTYLYIVNAVIFKLLLTSYLKRDLAKNNNNFTTLICLAIFVRAKALRDPLVQYSQGLNWHGYNMSMWIDMACCFGKWRGSTETPSKLFTNHNALGQLTNHNTFRFSEAFIKPRTNRAVVPGWGERYCNNVNVKNNAIFEPPSMRCSSTPPKQNQDFVKEHNRTPLKQTWHY